MISERKFVIETNVMTKTYCRKNEMATIIHCRTITDTVILAVRRLLNTAEL